MFSLNKGEVDFLFVFVFEFISRWKLCLFYAVSGKSLSERACVFILFSEIYWNE